MRLKKILHFSNNQLRQATISCSQLEILLMHNYFIAYLLKYDCIVQRVYFMHFASELNTQQATITSSKDN